MKDLNFKPLRNAAPMPGLVLRIQRKAGDRYLRITHVFSECVYGMWIGPPKDARYARRPTRMALDEFDRWMRSPSASLGKVSLPPVLSTSPNKDSPRYAAFLSAWDLISPLIEAFKSEANLERNKFTLLIRAAVPKMETKDSFATLRRLILRFYYFGGSKYAILPLRRGPPPDGTHSQRKLAGNGESRKRRGRKHQLEKEIGPNEFIVDDDDIADMIKSVRRKAAGGPTFIKAAYEDYLAKEFRRSHRALHKAYTLGKILEPVSYWQYYRYTRKEIQLDEQLARNFRKLNRTDKTGSSIAQGPGEAYEIDATIGRIFLVSEPEPNKPPVLLGKPTVYLIIDRFSRFVVGVYLSLRPASYEEVRHAFLVAFTSRERRFEKFNVDIDDIRWPTGRLPFIIISDRGPELISESMEAALVDELHLIHEVLPPLCPDGKAIIERFIETMKARMSEEVGAYLNRPMDPRSKRTARKAEAVAINSIADAYRRFIEIVQDHNNRTHSELKKMKILAQARVAPTPQAAYLWGLENITGLRNNPLTEEDFFWKLLPTDRCYISNGVLHYKKWKYLPDNEAAVELLRSLPLHKKREGISIKVDKTYPYEVFVPSDSGERARFAMCEADAVKLQGLDLEEEHLLSPIASRLASRVDYDSQRRRVVARSSKRRLPKRDSPTKLDGDAQRKARELETAQAKRALKGLPPKEKAPAAPEALSTKATKSDWRAREAVRRDAQVRQIKEARERLKPVRSR